MATEIEFDLEMEPSEEHLVTDVRTRSHVVLPIDDLVAQTIVREEQEVVVGESDIGTARTHVLFRHESIVHRPSTIVKKSQRYAARKCCCY